MSLFFSSHIPNDLVTKFIRYTLREERTHGQSIWADR